MASQFGSLGYTIMGKTADLTVVQKTIINTLHKEGKTQTFIAKEAGCSQSAVSKHVNRKLSGMKKCGRKRCTTNRNCSIMRIVKQNRFKNLGELQSPKFHPNPRMGNETLRPLGFGPCFGRKLQTKKLMMYSPGGTYIVAHR